MFEIGVIVGKEVGGVDPGEGLVERVLEQSGRAHGQRFGHYPEVFPQASPQFAGQPGPAEGRKDVIVRLVREDDIVEVVGFEEIVELLDTDDGRFRDGYA